MGYKISARADFQRVGKRVGLVIAQEAIVRNDDRGLVVDREECMQTVSYG